MKYDPEEHHRRSIRLKHYDYSTAGAYFVTICARNRECLFGNVVNSAMRLSSIGEIIQNEWNTMPNRFPNIELDEFIIMPNHIHGIILVGAIRRGGLPMIIGQAFLIYKSGITRWGKDEEIRLQPAKVHIICRGVLQYAHEFTQSVC